MASLRARNLSLGSATLTNPHVRVEPQQNLQAQTAPRCLMLPVNVPYTGAT